MHITYESYKFTYCITVLKLQVCFVVKKNKIITKKKVKTKKMCYYIIVHKMVHV